MSSLRLLVAGTMPLAPTVAAASDIDVVIPSGDGQVLAGTLTLPSAGTAPFPVVITITGSGAHFRDGNR